MALGFCSDKVKIDSGKVDEVCHPLGREGQGPTHLEHSLEGGGGMGSGCLCLLDPGVSSVGKNIDRKEQSRIF